MKGLSIIVLIWIFLYVVSFAGDKETNIIKHEEINSEQKAVSVALKYTGFNNVPDYEYGKNTSARIYYPNNDSTPYINDRINGNKVWVVAFENINLNSIINYTDKSVPHMAGFSVMLDAASGEFLKIHSVFKNSHNNYFRSNNLDRYIKNLKSAGNNFSQPPIHYPAPYIEALRNSHIDITQAVEMDVVYIDLLADNKTTQSEAHWITILYGYPETSSPPIAIDNDSNTIDRREIPCITTLHIESAGSTGKLKRIGKWSRPSL